MNWYRSWRADPRARLVADRHYNRQKVGAAQFVPPGGCLVLATDDYDALWVTSTPLAEYVKHEWAGAWVNSLFRNEARCKRCYIHAYRCEELPCFAAFNGKHEFAPRMRSSELIAQAVAASLAALGPAPARGIVLFVDAEKTRRKRDPGRCYRRAGWRHVGFTKVDRLWVFQQLPSEMPRPIQPRDRQASLSLSGDGGGEP